MVYEVFQTAVSEELKTGLAMIMKSRSTKSPKTTAPYWTV